jgi:cell division septation protein DedD
MDTALKQRLIGAAVLVALAVIFLPMLVKGPAPDSGVSDVSLKMPDAPAGDMETRELPLAAPGQVPQGGAVGMDATPVDRPAATATPADAAAVPGQPPADGTTPPGIAPADATAPAGALPPTAAAGDYAVHFGAYATQKGADTVVALAKNAGLPAYSESATVNGKPAFRVRIGPYATRAEAESVRLKALEVRSDVPVRVDALDAEPAATTPAAAAPATAATATVEPPKPAAVEPPKPAPAKPEPKSAPPVAAKPEPKPVVPAPTTTATAKPATAPPVATTKPAPVPAKPASTSTAASQPLTPVAPKSSAMTPVAPKPTAPPPATVPAAARVGFAVQVGAFSDPTEAGALREKLRAAGFTAFTETVSTDKGKLVRVRVGPSVDRAAADQLKAQVQAKVGIDGIVRPYP